MARFFIIGSAEDQDLWLVDTRSRTVTPMKGEPSDHDAEGEAGAIASILAKKGNGVPVIEGMAVAIAADDRSAITSHQVWASQGGLTSHQVFSNSAA